jgi:diguanylate cyclase (GGDEF)-like protein
MERPVSSRIPLSVSRRRLPAAGVGRRGLVRVPAAAESTRSVTARGAGGSAGPAAIVPAAASLPAARLLMRSLARDNARLREEVARLCEVVAQVSQLAYRDPLTGLPNRALLLDRLAQAMARADRDAGRVAVLLLDLDRFKEVNDRLGHACGDRLLRSVAERFVRAVRDSDTVGRYGGDEFVVVLSDVEGAQAVERVASALRACLGPPMRVGGHAVQVGASIGVALYPDDGRSAAALLELADARMYRDKAASRPVRAATHPAAAER